MSKQIVKWRTALDGDLDIEHICDCLCAGQTLAKYCEDRRLQFGEVRRWIKNTKEHEAAYAIALELRKEHLIQRLCGAVMDMAGFDPATIFLVTEDGRVGYKPVSDWQPDARAALQSIDVDGMTGKITKVRFTDRLKAIELLGRTLAMYADKGKVEGKQTLADLILKARDGDKEDNPSTD